MHSRRLLRQIAILMTLLGAGCGGEGTSARPKLAPVKGKVVYNGQPVADALVAFHAEGAPRQASGVTDAEGRFQLTMFNTGDGAMLGDNVVTVTKKPAAPPPTATGTDASASLAAYDEMYKKQQAGGDNAEKDALPAKYGDPASSPQKNHVVAGSNEFTIELKD